MKEITSEHATFVVRILNTQNATWQGTVTWMGENRVVPFRSTLEMIRLIDSAVTKENADMNKRAM